MCIFASAIVILIFNLVNLSSSGLIQDPSVLEDPSLNPDTILSPTNSLDLVFSDASTELSYDPSDSNNVDNLNDSMDPDFLLADNSECPPENLSSDADLGDSQKRTLHRRQTCRTGFIPSNPPTLPKTPGPSKIKKTSPFQQDYSRYRTRRPAQDANNPCARVPHSKSGRPKSTLVSCGGLVVGDSDEEPDLVLNCVPGGQLFDRFPLKLELIHSSQEM